MRALLPLSLIPHTQDVSNPASIESAASSLSQALGSSKLYAIVNNAGTGFSHGSSPPEILDTNTRGPRRVVDVFLPLLHPHGRIVNVGSGAGPMFFDMLDSLQQKKKYVNAMDEKEIELEIARIEKMGDAFAAYAGSKALLACYTMDLARNYPDLTVSIISPGKFWCHTLFLKFVSAHPTLCVNPLHLHVVTFRVHQNGNDRRNGSHQTTSRGNSLHYQMPL